MGVLFDGTEDIMPDIVQNAMNLDWGQILGTLMIRFVGVFVVLLVLMFGMMILGKIVSTLVERQEAKKSESVKTGPHTIALAEEPERQAGEEEIVAAIGAAIAMSMESERMILAPAAFGGVGAGSWATAGRATQMGSRLQGGVQRRPSP